MKKVKVLIGKNLEYLEYARRTNTGGFRYNTAGGGKSYTFPVALHNLPAGRQIENAGNIFTVL